MQLIISQPITDLHQHLVSEAKLEQYCWKRNKALRIETLILEQDVSYFFYTWVISSTYECVNGCNPSHKLLSDKCRSVILRDFLECANYDRHTDWLKRHLQTMSIYAHFYLNNICYIDASFSKYNCLYYKFLTVFQDRFHLIDNFSAKVSK